MATEEADNLRPGLREAHKLLSTLHDEIEAEHRATKGRFFGVFPRRRHYEIMGGSRALIELGFRLVDRANAVEPPHAD